MLLTVIRADDVKHLKPILHCAYCRLADAGDFRPTVHYRAHHIKLRVSNPRNRNTLRTLKLRRFHINLPLTHACESIHSNATNKRWTRRHRGTPLSRHCLHLLILHGPSRRRRTGEFSSGIQYQRPGPGPAPSIPGAHADTSSANFHAGTEAACTARPPVFRVSFRLRVLNAGDCDCCCCPLVWSAVPCVPVPERTTPPKPVAGREE